MAGIDTPMMFETVRDAIETLFNLYASGRYRVVGYQLLSRDAIEALDEDKVVEIFYSDGQFPDSKSSRQIASHDATYQIYYTVTRKAKADIETLDDPNSTAAEYQAALIASKPAARLADRALDELRRMICQIILDPVNQWLGIEYDGNKKPIANLRLTNFRKDAPLPRGGVVTVTASEQLTVSFDETFVGATPVAPAEYPYDVTNKFNTKSDAEGATPAQSGVKTASS